MIVVGVAPAAIPGGIFRTAYHKIAIRRKSKSILHFMVLQYPHNE
jgi:hypothetical protein